MTARNVWLVLTSLGVGPLIGGITFILVAFITDGIVSQGSAPPINSTLDYWPLIVSFSYALGAIPALISAIIMAFASPRLPRLGQRLIAAPVVGAVTSLAIVGVIVFSDSEGSVDDWTIIGVVGLTGAVAGFLCLALVEFFHPLPKPAAPTA